MEDITKTIMFTSPLQNGQSATIQYQTADGTILKTPKIEGQKSQDFPAFYTTSNVSMFCLFQVFLQTMSHAEVLDKGLCFYCSYKIYEGFQRVIEPISL